MRDGHNLINPKKNTQEGKSVETLTALRSAARPYLGSTRCPGARAQKRNRTHGPARGEASLLKRGWTREPRLDQFRNGGEGQPLRISRRVSHVEHGDSRVRDSRLFRGGERDRQGGRAGQERCRARGLDLVDCRVAFVSVAGCGAVYEAAKRGDGSAKGARDVPANGGNPHDRTEGEMGRTQFVLRVGGICWPS